MTRILLIRHCESTGQAPDAPLTAHGFAQAETLAQRLENQPIDYICCSPYLRARATIAPLATRAGRPVHIDPRLAERHLSPAPIPNWRDVVRASFSDPLYKLAGGESGADTLHRAHAAIADLLSGGHQLAVVVSHGQLLSLVLHAVDPAFGYEGWAAMRNPDVFVLVTDHERRSFTRLPD